MRGLDVLSVLSVSLYLVLLVFDAMCMIGEHEGGFGGGEAASVALEPTVGAGTVDAARSKRVVDFLGNIEDVGDACACRQFLFVVGVPFT